MASEQANAHPAFNRFTPPPEDGIEHGKTAVQQEYRPDSPSPSVSPSPAIGACPELSRCVSTYSFPSTISEQSNTQPRATPGSSTSRSSSAFYGVRSSSANYSSRPSIGGPKRRGYVRPQGTNFAASAQSRESVLSLGSIAHLQYYFARTGLLDGKGGRLMKKKDPNDPSETSQYDTSLLSPILSDSSYSSIRRSSVLSATGTPEDSLVDSPADGEHEYYSEDDEDPAMLPPTVSTYNHRPIVVPPPPTIEELKMELTTALKNASKVLDEARELALSTPPSPRRRSDSDALRPIDSPNRSNNSHGWYEIQGMHILDVITLAIAAAKHYYTAHDQPTRLSAIKTERQIRKELLDVMDVLKRMATRNFAGGMRKQERETMEHWIENVWGMVHKEEEMERRERERRRSWTWLDDNLWDLPPPTGVHIAREYAFLKSMDSDSESLPDYAPLQIYTDVTGGEAYKPSAFLQSLQNGVRLVKLHNALVEHSKRRFGAIPTFHTDTAKPYRCADNLRFWIKAAELRWEIHLKVDVMGVVSNSSQKVWVDFETAVWRWARKVREELTAELK